MVTTLDPLVYFTLKARMLELLLQERDLIAAKQAAFTAAGVVPGSYEFVDATCAVRKIEP